MHHPIPVFGEDLVARVCSFRAGLARLYRGRRARVLHVRGIFEGYPWCERKTALSDALVLEANGFPSIELKYHYPELAEDPVLGAKLLEQERRLAAAADVLVTPSRVTARELERRGVDSKRIEVIPNGVDEELFWYREPPRVDGRPLRLLYVGTASRWQGVHHAIEAMRLIRRDRPAVLDVVGPMRSRERRVLGEMAARLGLERFVTLHEPRPQRELVELYHRSDVALVPLTACDRNLVQGCCPLKLLEAMAAGTPVVASALEVVTDLAQPEHEILAVRPGSPKAIKDAVLRLCAEPGLATRLARAARARVEAEHRWRRSCERLVECYSRRLGLVAMGEAKPAVPEARV
jgi:glycosyltransferase involved in cell wall biosynthesis